MYFPYIRGKQFDLIALRELAEIIGEDNLIHSVIEPVKEATSTLRITTEELCSANIPFTIILNPQVGEINPDSDLLIDFINNQIDQCENFSIGFIISSTTDLTSLNELNDRLEENYPITLIHKERYPDLDALQNFVDTRNIIYNIIHESIPLRRYRRFLNHETLIIFRDAFNSQRINADYAEEPDEFFTDEHQFFEEDGFIGFCDYTTIGEDYTESGFAPYAVAIHLTYERENGQIWIRHFVSDSNEDYSDVAGTYREALVKLIGFIEEENIRSIACNDFRTQYEDGHYPGLGSVKKLSIMHHIELVLNILQR